MEWSKLHNEEFYNVYSSPNVITQIKSIRMRWADHVACIGELRKVHEIFGGKARRKDTTWKTEA
jgi:hypothetical protein